MRGDKMTRWSRFFYSFRALVPLPNISQGLSRVLLQRVFILAAMTRVFNVPDFRWLRK